MGLSQSEPKPLYIPYDYCIKRLNLLHKKPLSEYSFVEQAKELLNEDDLVGFDIFLRSAKKWNYFLDFEPFEHIVLCKRNPEQISYFYRHTRKYCKNHHKLLNKKAKLKKKNIPDAWILFGTPREKELLKKPLTLDTLDNAAKYGFYDVVKFLLDVKKITPNYSTLMLAVQYGFCCIVTLLIDSGNGLNLEENHLEVAVKSDNFKMVKYLVDKKCPISEKALCLAATLHTIPILKILIDQKPKLTNQIFKSAISSDNFESRILEFVTFLHQNNCPQSRDLLEHAIQREIYEVLSYMLENNFPSSGNEFSTAVKNKGYNSLALYYLTNAGFKLSSKDMITAIKCNNLVMVKYLIKYKCPKSEKNEELIVAVQENNLDIAHYLVDNGYKYL